MAAISQKSKNTNTFRFKSFADRVGEIDIRRLALYRIGHENEDLPEENETYFHQTLKKWIVLNLTDEFGFFSRKCLKIVTLPQLVHQKDTVIDLLLERLSTATNLSLQPLLELLYVLARDLREEFYPYFPRVLDRLICLLNTQDAEQLEWTFVCLAYLFKSLKPYLKKNIGMVFHAILPLLDEQCYDENVTNFAVECFSFIARDVRDYRKFFEFILDTITREQVQSVRGCGRLLFEIMRGVKGQFHSGAGDFLKFIFECLIEEKRFGDDGKMQLFCEIVEETMHHLFSFIHPQSMTVFWTQICSVAQSAATASSIGSLAHLLSVFLIAVTHREGRYLAEIDVVVPTILKLVDCCVQLKDMNRNVNIVETQQLLVQLVSKVLLANNAQLTQLDTSRLIKKALCIQHRDIYEQFILLICGHPQFEILVLPAVVCHFEQHFDRQAFSMLAKIVLRKQPLAGNSCALKRWQPYAINLKQPKTLKRLQDDLKKFELFSQEENIDAILQLILTPHIVGLDTALLEAPLKAATAQLINNLNDGTHSLAQTLITLSLMLETHIHLKYVFSQDFLQSAVHALLPHATINLSALGTLNQLLTQNVILFASDKQIQELLATLLCSHSHDVRLIAAHSLMELHRHVVAAHPYKIFYAAECVEPNVQTYRELLLQLQKLDTSGEFYRSLQQDNFKVDTLRYLLGVLYHNFKYVWEPVLKIIEQYAKVMGTADFWRIYYQELEMTSKRIDYTIAAQESSKAIGTQCRSVCWHNDLLNDLLPEIQITQLTQQELLNYRNLLWLRLPQFGQVVQMKNRDLVPLFLQFVNDEYRTHLERRELTWNLVTPQKAHVEAAQLVNDEADSDAEEPTEEATPKRVLKSQPRRKQKEQLGFIARSILQTLQSKLGVFAVQPNPRALYREGELYSLYLEFLAGPNAQLQKAALDCVLTYKSKSLLPYKEHLYALIDEQKFKDELLNFKLDSVDTEQRKELMEILLRLLYGKMITKGTQRNMSSQVRKGLILRFLGQCSTTEIQWFLEMAFGKYSKYVNVDNMTQIPALVHEDFDLKAAWSPKKLQSIVNLLELIRKEFGGLMERDFHAYMLRLLTFVGSVCNEVLQSEAEQLHAKMPTVYRNVKNAALLSLVNFYAHIDEFQWQQEDVACLTEVYVWPAIAKLPYESIHTPTALLKLLLQWGEKPQHFAFLSQRVPKPKGALTIEAAVDQPIIFYYIVELLLNEKAKPAVRRPILALIERLLAYASASQSSVSEGSNVSIGLTMVKSFMPQILKRLKLNFNTRAAKHAIDKRDLNILSMLTAHVEDASTCDSLLQLLLPILVAKSQSSASEEVVTQIITTLSNLIKCLDAPETYLLKIAPLFEQTQEVNSRKMLCQLITDIAKKRFKQSTNTQNAEVVQIAARLKDTARIIFMLNAWDRRWVEQPDYDKRLDALKEITQLLEEGAVDIDLGVLVIYNCIYFIKYDKDMGLRDNAGEHLRCLLPKLTKHFANDKQKLEYLVGDVFINLVRRILRDHNDNVRHEGIRLLGEMARQCGFAHEILHDLMPLGDDQDVEVDFFENMTHLQLHRHGRALLKFCAHAQTLTAAPSVRTLTQFLLPLASRYLLQEKYAGKHTLIDAAIEMVGVVCQLLPWQHYHSILRYYLTKLRSAHEHQKQCVRIVVRILDAFHFDLTQAQSVDQAVEQLKGELKRMENEDVVLPIQNGNEQEKQQPKYVADEDDVLQAQQINIEDPENTLDAELLEDDESELQAEKPTEHKHTTPIISKSLLLTANASKRVLLTITTVLIPTLNRSITEQTSYDTKHKVNRKRFSAEREEEEILRVPIALALVKLMQKLPKALLDTSLQGVFMKVCTFLRSPLKSVRMLTRDILKKIMLTLGSSYLSMLMHHLQSLLTRGFQVHVLAVTVHGVLDALRDQLQPEDIENCLHNLLDVALNDIFGDVTAEKQVDKIAAHTPEAKPSAKSFLVLHIVARNIHESCLLDLLMPFKEHLARSHSRKITLKIQDCFAKIVNGLVENVHISRESLLIFIYGTMSESITDLLPGTQKRVLSEHEKELMRRSRPDCFIIQPAPRYRSGAVNKQVKSNAQANAHILIEFGLEMLHIVLKRKKIIEMDYEPFLNPLLPLLRDALKSTHVRVATFALKCFAAIWNDGYELSALRQQYLSDVVERMFEILKNLSTFGAIKQEENFQLVKATYKSIVALLRKCNDYKITSEQGEQLALYVEQNLYEGENQVLSFSLLKAIVARKLQTSGLNEIMKRIGDMTIVSESEFVRDEARTILITYLMEYTLHKRVDQIIKFFTVQLRYSLPSGRQSVIRFLREIIKKFPLNILTKRAEFLYLSLAPRLVNDDDPECRQAIAECIELLITRLEKVDRQRLFDMTLLFFTSEHKASLCEMAASLCSRFLNVEKQSFAPRLKLVLPIIVARLSLNNPSAPGRFVRAPNVVPVDNSTKRKKFNKRHGSQDISPENEEEENTEEEQQRAIDHEIIQIQFCLLKILDYCSAHLFESNYEELLQLVDELAYESQRLLAHEHVWVRCNAAKIISQILANYDFALIGEKLTKTEVTDFSANGAKLDFIYANPAYDIKCLVLDLCAQVIPGDTTQTMIDEIVKIFLYVGNMLRNVPFVMKQEKNEDAAEQTESQNFEEVERNSSAKINLYWLVRNIRYLANKEVVRASHSTVIRAALFTLIEGLITLLSAETLERLAPFLLATLVREMSEEDQNVDTELRQQALRVGSRLRKRIGSDLYDKLRTRAQTMLMRRRAERKKIIAQEKIHDPIRAAKRKASMQDRKKSAKKLKTNVMRGKAADTKQKLKKRKRKAEDDIF